MKPLRDAQRDVLAAVQRLESVRVPVAEALGLALAEPVSARHDLPPFANSAMDGYAVIASDVAIAPVTLKVLEDVPAGSVPTREVVPGTAIKIMTGAPLPAGADAVVQVEDTDPGYDEVLIRIGAPAGTSVRPAGEDVAIGTQVLAAGERLTPARLGVCASLGYHEPLVGRRPRVAIMSTGDEIVPPNTPDLQPGKIRDANRFTLGGALEELGVSVIDFGIVGDDADELRARIIEPLGLTSTYLAGFEEGPAPFGAYVATSLSGPSEPIDFDYKSIATNAWAAGAVVSSAEDLHVLLSVMFDGNIVSSDSLAAMTESQDYGLGLVQLGPGLHGHGGSIPGYQTFVAHAPETGTTAFFVVTNDGITRPPPVDPILERITQN